MRKLLNIVIAVIIIVILLGAGAGGYLWYSTKQQVDQIVAMAQPFAQISYGGVTVSPAGSVGVSQLRIMSNFTNDSFTIGAIRLKAPNFLALLHTRWQLSHHQAPRELALSFEDFELPLSSSGFPSAGLSSFFRPEAQSSPLGNLDALGCGPVTTFGPAEWREMGYDRFISGLEIGYRADPKNNVLDLQMDSHMRNWATLKLDTSFALTKLPESPIELAVEFTPKLTKLNFVLRDDGFNQRRNAYCAAKAGKAIPDYLADHVRQVVERLRINGVTLGPGLIAAYQRYLTEGGTLTITATPPAPANLAELHEYAPADALKVLGLALKVNETTVADLTVDWDAAKLARILNPEPEPKPELETTTAKPAPQAPVMVQKNYHPTPVGELGQHVGKIVKLRTTTGAQYHGHLEAFAEGLVRVTVRKSGGSVTLSLRANEITQAEVLY